MSTHVLDHLDEAIDEVHALFDAWIESGAFASVLSVEGLDVLRLTVHEWIANLVQHATFPGAARIEFDVDVVDDGVRCTITDTSAGFDFAETVERQKSVLNAPVPSERGRGLLMLLKCAEDLDFHAADAEGPQRVAFTIRGADAGAMEPLFRPADLSWDEDLVHALASQGDGHVDAASLLPLDPEELSRRHDP